MNDGSLPGRKRTLRCTKADPVGRLQPRPQFALALAAFCNFFAEGWGPRRDAVGGFRLVHSLAATARAPKDLVGGSIRHAVRSLTVSRGTRLSRRVRTLAEYFSAAGAYIAAFVAAKYVR